MRWPWELKLSVSLLKRARAKTQRRRGAVRPDTRDINFETGNIYVLSVKPRMIKNPVIIAESAEKSSRKDAKAQ